jgi:hypothetical protein
MIMTCPPYGDLEKYSDDPADLSAMTHDNFLETYAHIIDETMSLLRDDSFACFVVGDYRDKKGFYRNFVSSTIDAVQATGAHLYNEAILVQMVGTGAMMASLIHAQHSQDGQDAPECAHLRQRRPKESDPTMW